RIDAGVRFGIIGSNQQVAMLIAQQSMGPGVSNESRAANDVSLFPGERAGVRGNTGSELRATYVFSNNAWAADTNVLRGLQINGEPVSTSVAGRDRGVRFRDLDNDGQTELIVGNEAHSAVFKWSAAEQSRKQQPVGFPSGASIV